MKLASIFIWRVCINLHAEYRQINALNSLNVGAQKRRRLTHISSCHKQQCEIYTIVEWQKVHSMGNWHLVCVEFCIAFEALLTRHPYFRSDMTSARKYPNQNINCNILGLLWPLVLVLNLFAKNVVNGQPCYVI